MGKTENKAAARELLSVENLSIIYQTEDGTVQAVNDLSFQMKKGETLGLVGETGAGKTTVARGIMRLIPDPPGKLVGGRVILDGEDIYQLSKKQLRSVRGKKVSMIFQDPMTALNPLNKVGDQIAEAIRLHKKVSRAEAAREAEKMLEMVGIPKDRYEDYPMQFSGGMKQRIVIAIALACMPELLIADEPTTALDVTIQAQVLELMNQLKQELGTSMIMITHDLGVVAKMCDRVAIVYAGQIIEMGEAWHIYDDHRHPYTEGLFNALPKITDKGKKLTPIPGMMPDPTNLPDGCAFAPRCPYKTGQCEKASIPLEEVQPGHWVRCLRAAK